MGMIGIIKMDHRWIMEVKGIIIVIIHDGYYYNYEHYDTVMIIISLRWVGDIITIIF